MPFLKRKATNPKSTECKILTAGLELFVRNGYHKVAVHDIQKLADVSIGSIYKHFGGKEGIAKALYTHLLDEMNEMIEDVKKQFNSPKEQCKEIMQLLCGYTDTRYNIMAFVFHAKHSEFVPEEPLICNSIPFIKMREIVEKGMENGEFKNIDSWVATSIIFGGVTRMIQLRLDKLIKKPLIHYYNEIVDASFEGLLENNFGTSDLGKTDFVAVS